MKTPSVGEGVGNKSDLLAIPTLGWGPLAGWDQRTAFAAPFIRRRPILTHWGPLGNLRPVLGEGWPSLHAESPRLRCMVPGSRGAILQPGTEETAMAIRRHGSARTTLRIRANSSQRPMPIGLWSSSTASTPKTRRMPSEPCNPTPAPPVRRARRQCSDRFPRYRSKLLLPAVITCGGYGLEISDVLKKPSCIGDDNFVALHIFPFRQHSAMAPDCRNASISSPDMPR